ncbi:hypothetical protein [Cryptosporangium aurantiacum]|uniref:Uncharacterized protein n=1 Tax=Cryptosporangium aurantiacum TaxID=134849 RepID=A0A1M7PSW9_9ACTN|nr:hypothetical protein [Cryptosporangium aurantiacum]SHN20565.1 hypothetical protein SAMN05443668_103652 [Cryptosporangium aurantiacum]
MPRLLSRLLDRIADVLVGPPRGLSARAQLSLRLAEEPPPASAIRRTNKQLQEHGLTGRALATTAACAKCGTRDRPLAIRRLTRNLAEWRCDAPECAP